MTSTSTLYQGLQSCLEPSLLEHHVLMNKLTPPKSTCPQSKITRQEEEEEIEDENGLSFSELQNQNDNGDVGGGWSFIQALVSPCPYPKKGDAEDEVYVHPLVKLCSLDTKSLEMCTESLGTETGSDISENIEEFSSFLSERETNSHGAQRSKFAKKFNRATSFPPPLTSMSGNEGVQVRPHRENGHLVLKAVTITSSNSYFQAERADGRLRLSLLKDDPYYTSSSSEEDSDDEIRETEHENTDENDDEIATRNILASEIGVGEYSRPRRCKASGNNRSKGISSWEPFWVAIS